MRQQQNTTADEEREHRLPTFQQNTVNRIRTAKPKRGKFTVKIIFFDATIGSYTICKIDTKSIFPTD